MRWVEVEGGAGGTFVDEEGEEELDEEPTAAAEPEAPIAAAPPEAPIAAAPPEPVVAEPVEQPVAAAEPEVPEVPIAPAAEPVAAPPAFPGLDREPVAWDATPEPVAPREPAAASVPAPAVPAAQTLLDETDAALAAGDTGRARLLLIDLARSHVAAGRRDAALDACYRALAIAPDDLTLHLLLVQLYLENGWRDLAAEKVELLERLTELDGDETALTLVRSARRVVAGKRQAG